MIDRWLDDYEELWCREQVPPDLFAFIARLPESEQQLASPELALIDLEHRWKRFFRANPHGVAPGTGSAPAIPLLPTWSDYSDRLQACHALWLDGICHEFRVRQLFGDRTPCRDFLARYTAASADLADRLPAIAAELTQATVILFDDGRLLYSCHLPGRLEVGRCRAGEPPAPALATGDGMNRLLIADSADGEISRAQCQLEVVAKDRVLVRHKAAKGSVTCCPGRKLRESECCEVQIPLLLIFQRLTVRIERRQT